MSLHPLSSEMVVNEVVLGSGLVAGGVWAWQSNHRVLAVGAWLGAVLLVVAIVATAFTDPAGVTPTELLRRLARGLVAAASLGALGWAGLSLHARGSTALGVLVVVVGLVVGPLLLGVVRRNG